MILIKQLFICFSFLAFSISLNAQPTSFEEYFTGSTLESISTGSAAGMVTNFTLDTDCEVLLLSVADPSTAPLPAFNAYQVTATDDNSDLITNIEGIVNTTFRVTTFEEVRIDILFRSGGGSMSERSERKSITIPGGLDQWTEFTLTWSDTELDGFDPTDFRDMWFYLDRGTENFAGNEFYIDHITIGTAPDASQNSSCVFVSAPQNWTENWDSSMPTEFLGSDVDRLNITTDETCEEVKIEVIDVIGNPYQALRPIILDPLDANGLDIGFINGNPFVNIRARSAEDVELGVLLRSKDGTADFRTDLLTQTIVGDLTAYSNLLFEFEGASLGDFDTEEFLDIWIYLDREVDNFAGNEVYFDFAALGEMPNTDDFSPCGLPDLILDSTEDLFFSGIKAYPNPATNILTVDIPQSNSLTNISIAIYNTLGETVLTRQIINQKSFELQLENMEAGLYKLDVISDEDIIESIKFIKL